MTIGAKCAANNMKAGPYFLMVRLQTAFITREKHSSSISLVLKAVMICLHYRQVGNLVIISVALLDALSTASPTFSLDSGSWALVSAKNSSSVYTTPIGSLLAPVFILFSSITDHFSSKDYSSALKMKAAGSSETFVYIH
jgi:hypothetical protein